MPAPEEPPLARSIGAFFGHIVEAIVSEPDAKPASVSPHSGAPLDAGAPRGHAVRSETIEERRPDGVVLRRTVIEEVVLPPGMPIPPAAAPARELPKH
jgi:hypothetical protein